MNIIPAIYQNRVWQIGDSQISCDSQLITQLQLRDGQGLDLGIRAEYLTIESDPIESGLFVTIKGIETQGRETLIKAQINGTSILINLLAPPEWLARSQSDPRERLGAQLTLGFLPEWLFIFDPSTGRRLFPDL